MAGHTPQVGMLAQRLDACLLRRSCVAIHAARWYTLHAKPLHLLSLAAGRCRTTGGRAVMTWRTWRNGRSCLQTYGGRHLTNRSCCAGGSTRGDRRQPTRASRRDSVNALSYCLHVSRTSEIRESCVALYHPSARVRPPGRLFFRFRPRGFGAFANRARATRDLARSPRRPRTSEQGRGGSMFTGDTAKVRDTHSHTRGDF